MTASIFAHLGFEQTNDTVKVRYPSCLHTFENARTVAQEFDVEVERLADEAWGVCFDRKPAQTYPDLPKRFFARLNGYPAPYATGIDTYRRPENPQVSCIVVLNENLPFVREHLIPSLLANSPAESIEIIVVCNGATDPGDTLGFVETVRSRWGAVARAYNLGVSLSRGATLAIFHDDVVVDDADWLEKCRAALAAGATAISPEIRALEQIGEISVPSLPIAKNVPLVISRADYDRSGGYDENHYIGYEDLDFTLALKQRGMSVHFIDLAVRHFHGMSSTLKYTRIAGLAELYAFTALPREAIEAYFLEIVQSSHAANQLDFFRVSKEIQLLYVLQKYQQLLMSIQARPFHRARRQLERDLRPILPATPAATLQLLERLDRQRCGQSVMPG